MSELAVSVFVSLTVQPETSINQGFAF